MGRDERWVLERKAMGVDQQVWRVLDANGNRAAEGLRVLEEVARLVREDEPSAATLKQLRHDLAAILSGLDRSWRLSARSTQRDPGTGLTSQRESTRASLEALISAESSRVGEALRTLEEFAKLVDPEISSRFKQLRYRAYDDLARIELAWTRHAWLDDMRLCLLIDCAKPLDDFIAYLRGLAQAGLRCVQIRDKRLDGRHLVAYARCAVETLAPLGGQVVVNDRVDVALASGAAGVHVGQDDLHIEDVRRQAGQRLVVGVSTHDIEQARQAVKDGADYIGCGPTFPSATKRFEAFAGVEFLRQVAAEIDIPCLAIGGIALDNLDEVIQTGVRGVAVSAAVHQAADPTAVVAEFQRRLGR